MECLMMVFGIKTQQSLFVISNFIFVLQYAMLLLCCVSLFFFFFFLFSMHVITIIVLRRRLHVHDNTCKHCSLCHTSHAFPSFFFLFFFPHLFINCHLFFLSFNDFYISSSIYFQWHIVQQNLVPLHMLPWNFIHTSLRIR